MNQKFYNAIEKNPIIAAVKDMNGLKKAVALEDIQVIFLLFGDILSLGDIIKTVKRADKIAVVHIDLIVGLGSKDISVDYIKINTEADGIISTKPSMIKRAKELGLYTVIRYFVIDSMALENVKSQANGISPDLIEILPGAMPKVIEKISRHGKIPVIAGGLITDKEDVVAALSAGAIAVSSTNHRVWTL